jgi:integrase
MPKLTDQTLKKKTKAGERTDAQTPGLTLVVRASTSAARPNAKRRSWLYRFTLNGTRQKMGLGPYPAVTLEEARKKALKAAAWVAKGIDPRLVRREDPANLTFRDAAEAYLIEALPRYPSAKSKYILQLALRVHCAPLASRPVLEIGTRDFAKLLRSIASTRPAMAGKVHEALRGLFAHVGIDMEDRGVLMRNPLTPAGLKAAHFVPAPAKGRYPALDPAEAYAFLHVLRAIPSIDARLLEFLILTVARTKAARLVCYDQIDVKSCVWRVPVRNLKDGRFRKGEPFIVPLSPRALELVEATQRPGVSSSAFIFSDGGDEPRSETALISLLRRMCRVRPWLDPTSKRWITTHGFRSSFRTWCQKPRRDRDGERERERWDREVVEISMGHRFHGVVEGRYARDDLLDERRNLLDAWASYLDTPPAGAKIIPYRRA